MFFTPTASYEPKYQQVKSQQRGSKLTVALVQISSQSEVLVYSRLFAVGYAWVF